tara:strand:- start:233 stop:415 length:183 start_codon:yes stop_codon:yes gene_type:complete
MGIDLDKLTEKENYKYFKQVLDRFVENLDITRKEAFEKLMNIEGFSWNYDYIKEKLELNK